jgi:hypothetical protein
MVVKIVGLRTLAEVTNEINTEFYFQHILSQRSCPHVLSAYACSTRRRQFDPQLGYMYMEWAPYGSLQDLQRRLRENPK